MQIPLVHNGGLLFQVDSILKMVLEHWTFDHWTFGVQFSQQNYILENQLP